MSSSIRREGKKSSEKIILYDSNLFLIPVEYNIQSCFWSGILRQLVYFGGKRYFNVKMLSIFLLMGCFQDYDRSTLTWKLFPFFVKIFQNGKCMFYIYILKRRKNNIDFSFPVKKYIFPSLRFLFSFPPSSLLIFWTIKVE